MGSSFERPFRRVLEFAGIGLVFSLVVIVVIAVVLRKAGHSLQWYDEVASILLAWITYIGAAYAALNRSHLAFTDLVAILPRGPRAVAFICAELIVVGFLGLLIYGFYILFPVLQGLGLASIPSIPVWFAQLALPIGAFLFIIAEIFSFQRGWSILFEETQPSEIPG